MVLASFDPLAVRVQRGVCLSVVSHGQGPLVDRLLRDLAALPPGTVARVVVTINRPGDPWAPDAAVAALPLRVIRNPVERGFGANHNRAFVECDEDVFVVANPDIRLPTDPFAELVRHLRADPRCALVAPLQVDAAGRRETFARRVPTPASVLARRLVAHLRKGSDDGTGAGRANRAHWLAGAFMVWRADAYRALDGFDERYFLYCEDVDICLRLQLRGQRFEVVESARVVHDAQRASGASPRHLLLHLKSLCLLWASAPYWRFLAVHRAPSVQPT